VLSAAQQERFARHLLLDDLGGEGQERLVASAAAIDLPEAFAQVARWAVRYLAASGVGTLVLRGPWAVDCARECADRWPDTRVLFSGAAAAGAVLIDAAGAVLIDAAGAEVTADPGGRIAIAAEPRDAAEAASVGALAALEALKRIASAGRPAAQPLRFAAAEPAEGRREGSAMR
jgi:hypothetical protein